MAAPGVVAALELKLHPGDEYVGSWEPESLQVLSYVKLSKASPALNINTSCYSTSATGHCPVLLRGLKKVASGSEEVLTYLKEQALPSFLTLAVLFSVGKLGGDSSLVPPSFLTLAIQYQGGYAESSRGFTEIKQGFNIDAHLKDNQQAEVVAYAALLKDRLLPAILYSRWLDSQNYVESTRHWYAQLLGFPFSLLYLSWSHRSVQRWLMAPAPPECTEEQRGMELLNKAEECIKLLSARLGDEDYFYGERPSSLDALVFGYLEVILQCPLPSNNSVHRTMHSCVNLKSFCDRIRRGCFPDKKQRSMAPPVRKSTSATLWRDPMLWASVGVAVLLLGLQGVRVGLFSRLGAWVASQRHRAEEEYQTY